MRPKKNNLSAFRDPIRSFTPEVKNINEAESFRFETKFSTKTAMKKYFNNILMIMHFMFIKISYLYGFIGFSNIIQNSCNEIFNQLIEFYTITLLVRQKTYENTSQHFVRFLTYLPIFSLLINILSDFVVLTSSVHQNVTHFS